MHSNKSPQISLKPHTTGKHLALLAFLLGIAEGGSVKALSVWTIISMVLASLSIVFVFELANARETLVSHELGSTRNGLLSTLEARVQGSKYINEIAAEVNASNSVRNCVSMAYLQLTACLAGLRANGKDDQEITYCIGNHILVDLEGIRGYEQYGYKHNYTRPSCCGVDRASQTFVANHEGHRYRMPKFRKGDLDLCNWARESWAGTSVEPTVLPLIQVAHLGEVGEQSAEEASIDTKEETDDAKAYY